jgi:hypothetical protein
VTTPLLKAPAVNAVCDALEAIAATASITTIA